MKTEKIPAVDSTANLKDYDHTYATFRWEDVEREFDWYTTGRINMAH